jgi:hypothetical protein
MTEDVASESSQPPASGRLRARTQWQGTRSTLVAVGVAVGFILAGLGVAAAQTSSSTTTPEPGSSSTVPNAEAPAPGPGFKGHGFRHGFGLGLGALHGEFTTPAPGGGYQTLATQAGQVTSVDASSIAVKSEDGFTRTYSVDDNTIVTAGNNGIADVKSGDDVHVIGVVEDGKARAVEVIDITNVKTLGEKWRPPRPDFGRRSASSSNSA